MNRRDTVFALLALSVTPLGSVAQQQGKVWRVGFLAVRSRSTPSRPEDYYDAFTRAMHDLGYIEGKNLVIEWRFANGKYERLPDLAAQLVRLNLDVIVSHSTPAIKALQRATSTIPIVATSFSDPVGSGFASSLAHPGGNITGLSIMSIDTSAKNLELLKLMVPSLSRVAFFMNPVVPAQTDIQKIIQTTAKQYGVKVLLVRARTPEELEHGFAALLREHADAVIIPNDAFFIGRRRQIVELATRNRLPSMFQTREDVEAGGLMSYGHTPADSYRRAADFVDKILKGAKPGELPIEQPTKINLVINRKTATALAGC